MKSGRSLYKASAVFTEVLGADRKKTRCNNFGIDRGVLQGDITFPLNFIMALELIMRTHDAENPQKGVNLADTIIHILGYADDAVILEDGTPSGVQQITERVNSISQGSKQDADILLNTDKTVAMHVRAQEEVPPATQDEAREVCKFTCPHLNCGYAFDTKVGMLVHAGGCEWKDEFEVDFITNHRGPITRVSTTSDGRHTPRTLTHGSQEETSTQNLSKTMSWQTTRTCMVGGSGVTNVTSRAPQ